MFFRIVFAVRFFACYQSPEFEHLHVRVLIKKSPSPGGAERGIFLPMKTLCVFLWLVAALPASAGTPSSVFAASVDRLLTKHAHTEPVGDHFVRLPDGTFCQMKHVTRRYYRRAGVWHCELFCKRYRVKKSSRIGTWKYPAKGLFSVAVVVQSKPGARFVPGKAGLYHMAMPCPKAEVSSFRMNP